MTDIIKFLKTVKPKTEEEIIEEIKEYVEETENLTLKELNKKIKTLSVPYDYKKLCEELLKRFNVVYKIPDVKKLLIAADLIPDDI